MTTEKMIEREGGVAGMREVLGMEIGTEKDVVSEMTRRLNARGIFETKTGEWCSFTFGGEEDAHAAR